MILDYYLFIWTCCEHVEYREDDFVSRLKGIALTWRLVYSFHYCCFWRRSNENCDLILKGIDMTSAIKFLLGYNDILLGSKCNNLLYLLKPVINRVSPVKLLCIFRTLCLWPSSSGYCVDSNSSQSSHLSKIVRVVHIFMYCNKCLLIFREKVLITIHSYKN